MWTLARLHLLRILKRPGLLIFLLILPVGLCWLEYLVFSGPAGAGPVPMVVVDEDHSQVSARLASCLTHGVGDDDLLVTRASGWQEAWSGYAAGQYLGVVSFPRGLAATLLARGVPHVGIAVPDRTAGALAIRSGVRACLRREQANQGLARLGDPAPVAVHRDGPMLTTQAARADFVRSHFPGLVVFALLFAAQAMAAPLWRDRTSGTDARLETNGAGAMTRFAGAFLYMLIALSLFVLALVLPPFAAYSGRFAALPELIAAAVAIACFAALLQLFLVAMTGSLRAAQSISSMVALLLALAGGSFLPLSLYPASLRASLVWLPNASAQEVMSTALASVTGSDLSLWVLLAWVALTAVIAVLATSIRTARSLP